MAILTPSELVSASNATYFDNISGSITPTSVRSLNDNWISSSILASQTGSFATTGSNSFLGNQTISGSVAISGSYFQITASNGIVFKPGTDIQFLGNTVFTNPGRFPILNVDSETTGNGYYGFNNEAEGRIYQSFSSSVVNRILAITGSGGSINTGSFATTGSNIFTGTNSFNIISASHASVVSASIEYLSVIYQTSSIIYSSGSNQFGDAANDTQTLFGTVDIKTGPLLVSGSVNSLGGFTGSLLGTALTASFAQTARTAVTASNLLMSNTSLDQNYFLVLTENQTGPYPPVSDAGIAYNPSKNLLDGFNSKFRTKSEVSGSLNVSGSTQMTGNLNVTQGITGSLLGTASYASQALSSSYALTASFALNASIETGSFATTGSNTFTGTQTIVTGSSVKFEMNTSTQSLQLQKHNVLNELIVINPDNNEKIIGFDYDTLYTRIQFGIDTGIRFEGIDAKGRTINISSSLELQNTLNVLGDSLLTGSLVVKPSQLSTEYPFPIIQASDGTSRGGNIISTRNTSVDLSGSVIVSGSQNLILLSGGGDTSAFGIGASNGFNGINSIVTAVPFITGSNGSGYDRPLPSFVSSIVNRFVNVTDNRPATLTTPITLTSVSSNSTINYTTSTGSVNLANSNLAGTGTQITVTGSNGTTKTIQAIGVVGTSNLLLIDSPSAASSYTGVTIGGSSNTVLVSGSNTTMQSVNVMGYQLRATGSATATTNYGSLFAGRWNASDNTSLTKETAFLVGTGTTNTARRTSFHVSASGLTTVSNGLTVTGSTSSSFNVASTFNQGTTFNQITAFNQTPSFNAQANFGNVVSFTGSRFAATLENNNDIEALSETRFGINVRNKNFSTSGSEYFLTVNTGSNTTSHTLNAQYGGTVGSIVLSNTTGSTAFAVSASSIQLNGNTGVTGNLTIQSGSGDLFVYGNKQFNGAEYLSTQTQSGSSAVSQSVTFNTNGVQYGVSLADNTKITVANSGTYNIQFSAQVLADTGADDVWIWFKKNGTNIANSATRIALSNNEEDVITVNILEEAAASDYFEIVWQSANGDAVLLAETAAGNYPAIPSIIATVTQVR
jgi:hypothetical protein